MYKKILGVLVGLGVFGVASIAFANPSFFDLQAASSTSTSTPSFMTAGTATTTVVYDAYNLGGTNQGSSYSPYGTNSSGLLIQLNATNTSTTLGWRYEYSDTTGTSIDCSATPTACDWYADNFYGMTAASTTPPNVPIVVNTPTSYTWTFASSTSMCDSTLSAASNNRGCKIVMVPTPTRWVRVVFTLPIGSSNGAVYAKFVPKKESK